MPSSPVNALSLDLWGTLIKSDPGFKPRRNEVLRTTFAPGVSEGDFDHYLRQTDRAADDHCVASGVDLGFEDRVLRTLDALAVARPSDDELAPMLEQTKAAQADLAREFHPLAISPEVPDLLCRLRDVIPVASTSNTGMLPGALMRDLLHRAGFEDCFDVQVFSDEVQAKGDEDRLDYRGCKPYRAIFMDTFQGLLGVDLTLHLSQVVHIGDNYVADVCGAAGFGFRSSLVNVPGAMPIERVLHDLLKGVS